MFESFHRDINLADAVAEHCAVLTELEYGQYRKEIKLREAAGMSVVSVQPPGTHDGTITPDRVYLCRRGYNPTRSRFFTLSPDESIFAPLPRLVA